MFQLGVDLGTTFSLAAFVGPGHPVELVGDAKFHGQVSTPSVVHVEGEHAVVGHLLERIVRANPALPVTRHAKLNIGDDTPLFVDDKARPWLPESISSLILKKLFQDATVKVPGTISGTAIGVPANFDSRQRLATRRAGVLSGLPNVQLVEEPVAAAACYAHLNGAEDQTLFVYDLGGGTFDATVVHSSGDGVYALSTLGSNHIGGRFFDDEVVADLQRAYQAQTGIQTLSVAAREVLRGVAIEAKSSLNMQNNYRLQKSLVVDGNVLDLCFTYHHLSRLIYPMLNDTVRLSEQCIREAGLAWDQIDVVILTGGSSLLPAVREKIAAASGKRAERIVCYQPHQAVAYGAALLAGSEGGSEVGSGLKLMQRISSYNLGIRTLNPATGEAEVAFLIGRNTPLPKTVKQTFYTSRKQQPEITVELVQSKAGSEDARALGKFSFGHINNDVKNAPIEIEITYGADGIVNVVATDPTTQVTVNRVISEEFGSVHSGDASASDFVQKLTLDV